MALEERTLLATEGIVVAAVEVARPPPPPPAESAADGAADAEQVLVCPFRSVKCVTKALMLLVRMIFNRDRRICVWGLQE